MSTDERHCGEKNTTYREYDNLAYNRWGRMEGNSAIAGARPCGSVCAPSSFQGTDALADEKDVEGDVLDEPDAEGPPPDMELKVALGVGQAFP